MDFPNAWSRFVSRKRHRLSWTYDDERSAYPSENRGRTKIFSFIDLDLSAYLNQECLSIGGSP